MSKNSETHSICDKHLKEQGSAMTCCECSMRKDCSNNDLKYCKTCIQMTNHMQDTCLKCGLATDKESNVPEKSPIDTILACRNGSMDDNQFRATVEHCIRTLIASAIEGLSKGKE